MATLGIGGLVIQVAKFISVAFICFALSSPASAQFTVGIDKSTQKFINKLLPAAKDTLLKALAEALPLIDKSVLSYLEKVDKIISENIQQATTAVQCGGVGFAAVVANETKTSLSNLLYAGPASVTIGDYTRHLSDVITNSRNELSTETNATEVVTLYYDLLMRAAIIKCAQNINPQLLQGEVDAQIARIKMPAWEWQLTIGEDRDRPECKTIHACVVQRRAQMTKMVAEADARDKETSQADALLASIPATPALPKKNWPWVAPSIQVLDYEFILASLRTVERSIEGARARRIQVARAALATAQGEASELSAFASRKILKGNLAHDEAIMSHHAGAVAKGRSAIGNARRAAELDAQLRSEVDTLVKGANTNITQADNLLAAAKADHARTLRDQIKSFLRDLPHRGMSVAN